MAFDTGTPAKFGELDAAARDDGHLFVAEKHHVACMAENGRRVGGDEELVLAEADDDGRAVADGDDLFRVVGRDRHKREEAAHVQERLARGIFERPSGAGFLLHQVGDDFCVGFGDECVPELLELALEVQVVLDDAVMDDDDLAGAVLVGMRVLFGGPAVRGPSRVPDAVQAFERLRVDRLLEIDEFAGASTALDLSVTDDSDARRVVAAILEATKPVDQNRDNFLRAEITDDSAHMCFTFYFITFHFLGVVRVLLPFHPALDVALPPGAHGEGSRRNVFSDGRPAADIGALADRDGRHQL